MLLAALPILALSFRGVPHACTAQCVHRCAAHSLIRSLRVHAHPLALAGAPEPQSVKRGSAATKKVPIRGLVVPTRGRLKGGNPPMATAQDPPSIGSIAASAALFVVIHMIVWGCLQTAGFDTSLSTDRSLFALARLLVIGGFIGIQRLAPGGLADDEWLSPFSPQSSAVEAAGLEGSAGMDVPAGVDDPPLQWLVQPYSPFLCAALFTLLSLLPAGIAAASGESELAAIILPDPANIQPGRALDLLVGAPIEEEVYILQLP